MIVSKTQETTIIGRDAEQAQLLDVLESGCGGKGGTIFLVGEAGIGKTRLAEECLTHGTFKVYRGKAIEEGTPPYGPVVSVLREYIKRGSGEQLSRGPFAKYLRLLLPELGSSPKEVDGNTLVEAIGAAISTMAEEQPLILFLDDLQWADNATLELLPHLTNRIQNERVVILATYRSDEIPRGHRIRWMRNELRRNRQLQEISLAPLAIDPCGVLVAQVLGKLPGQPLTKLIHEKTQGLPLFVEELCNALAASDLLQDRDSTLEMISGNTVPIPESVRDAVLLRLDGLSEESHKLLEVAAAVGVEFGLDLLVDVAGQEAGLDELFDRGLIVEIPPNRGSFRHALTREAILGEVTWSRRRALNRRIASYLESRGVATELIAEYWLAAKEHDKARAALLDSAEKSCQLHAYRDAAKAASQALEIWPDGEDEEKRLSTLERMAHCAQINGQLSDAVKAWREVLASPEIQSNSLRLGEAWRALAIAHGLQGAWEQSLAARIAAGEAFEKAKKLGEAAVEWLAAAGRHTALLHYNAAIEYCDKASKFGTEAKQLDVQARALGLRGNVLSMSGKHKQGIETVRAALSLALEHNLTEAASEVYRRLGSTLEYASDYTGSKEAYSTAFEFCQTQGIDAQAQLCLSCMSYVLFRTGDWKQCMEVCNDVTNNKNAPPGSKYLASAVIGLIRAFRGEIRPARKLLQQALVFSRREEVAAMELVCCWGLAMICEQDSEEDAEAHYLQLLDHREKTLETHDSLPALCSAATFFAARGRDKETTLCAEVLASIVSATGNTEALAALAYTLGETALIQNSPQEAAQQFQQALEHFEKLALPFEQTKTQFRLGVAAAETGRKEAAIGYLRNAYRIARKLGARPLASEIAGELDSLGATAEERRSSDAPERTLYGGLTSRQVEILKHIAAGSTNKEIAAKLFLSPRTVDMHVGHILERLDCRGRTEAVRKAGEMGLL